MEDNLQSKPEENPAEAAEKYEADQDAKAEAALEQKMAKEAIEKKQKEKEGRTRFLELLAIGFLGTMAEQNVKLEEVETVSRMITMQLNTAIGKTMKNLNLTGILDQK